MQLLETKTNLSSNEYIMICKRCKNQMHSIKINTLEKVRSNPDRQLHFVFYWMCDMWFIARQRENCEGFG